MTFSPSPATGAFITATDTGYGKTFIGALLSKRFFERGIKIQVRKPIESGCAQKDGVLMPEDGIQYYHAVRQTIPLDVITPYKLPHPVSPARAAEIENTSITTHDLQQACLTGLGENECLLVEGAGGFYSPLTQDGNNADLAKCLNLPILLVAANRLGCINHIMLTLEAIESQKLGTLAIVLNQIEANQPDDLQNNLVVLKKLCKFPIIEFPYSYTSHGNNPLNKGLDYLIDLIISP